MHDASRSLENINCLLEKKEYSSNAFGHRFKNTILIFTKNIDFIGNKQNIQITVRPFFYTVYTESPSPAHRVRQRRAVLDKRGRHEPVRVFASRWERHRLLRVGWELARGDGVAGEPDVLGSDLLPQPGEDELLRVLSNDARGVKRLLDA